MKNKGAEPVGLPASSIFAALSENSFAVYAAEFQRLRSFPVVPKPRIKSEKVRNPASKFSEINIISVAKDF